MYKNPMDFTPKEVYKELDRQAKYDREHRFYFKVCFVIAVFTAMAIVVLVLR